MGYKNLTRLTLSKVLNFKSQVVNLNLDQIHLPYMCVCLFVFPKKNKK